MCLARSIDDLWLYEMKTSNGSGFSMINAKSSQRNWVVDDQSDCQWAVAGCGHDKETAKKHTLSNALR